MNALVASMSSWILAQTAGAPGTADPAPVPSAVEVANILDFVQKGGIMMIPIGLCSLFALTVIVERFISLRRGTVIPPAFLPGLQKLLKAKPGDKEAAIASSAAFSGSG